MLLDTHCHLTHERYAGELHGLLGRAWEAGVGGVVGIASDLEDTRALREVLVRLDLDPEFPVAQVWGTAGVHPHAAAEAPRDLRPRLAEALAAHPRIVAVGECGLDYHYDRSPRPAQRSVFRRQLESAREHDLPVVVHCRRAEEDMAAAVREAGEGGVRGVLHCFPGDLKLLDAALEVGWLVSFTGLVTFSSFEGLEAVRAVPSDRYMLETDGPYMAPVPHRGKRNEPAFVPHIRDRIADLRGELPARVEEDTTATARRFFRLPDPPLPIH